MVFGEGCVLGLRAYVEVFKGVTVFEREFIQVGLLFDQGDEVAQLGLVVDLDAGLPVGGSYPDLDLHFLCVISNVA